MFKDFLGYTIAITSLILGFLLCYLFSFFDFEGLKDFQTIIAALIAFFAALMALDGVIKQIDANNKNHQEVIHLHSLQHQYAIYQKNYGVAACISGEIHGLITRIEKVKYLDFFYGQKQMLIDEVLQKVTSLPVKGNYFLVFESLSSNLGMLDSPLPKEICEWYVWARGFLDTVNAALDGYYEGGNQLELVQTLIDDIEGLTAKGKNIIQKLDNYAERNYGLAADIKDLIDRKINKKKFSLHFFLFFATMTPSTPPLRPRFAGFFVGG